MTPKCENLKVQQQNRLKLVFMHRRFPGILCPRFVSSTEAGDRTPDIATSESLSWKTGSDKR